MPGWVFFNWGSRGPHYKVGGVYVADFLWEDTLQINVYGHDAANNLLLNVFHVNTPTTPTLADCEAVANLVVDWVDGGYNNCYAETTSSDRVVVTDVSAINSWQAEQIVTAAGQLVGAPLSSNDTLAVKKSTGRRGRPYRGDWYVWAPTSSQIELLDGNLFLESYRDTCVSQLNILRTTLEAEGYLLVVASEATGETTVVRTFVAVDRKVDSQRRRLSGRGQ